MEGIRATDLWQSLWKDYGFNLIVTSLKAYHFGQSIALKAHVNFSELLYPECDNIKMEYS